MAGENPTGIDPKRLVAIFYVAAALALGVFLEKVVGLVFAYAKWSDPALFGEDWTLSTVIGYGVAVIAAVASWRTPRVRELSMQVAQELKRVTWPTLRETRAATVAVVAATFAAAVLLGFFDFVWARLSQLVLRV